jgi:hypothetical protein
MTAPAGIAQLAAPFAGLFNRARLGFPRHYFRASGGIGDDLMGTTVFHELKKRDTGGLALATQNPVLFDHNPDVNQVLWHPHPSLNRWLREGLPFVRLGYADYDPARDADVPPPEHILAATCRLAGITGPVELRPYLFLTREELAAGRLADKQVAMQSSGLAAAYPMRNKEWYPPRFQEVCSVLGRDFSVIQLGSASDPKLEGATDLRGKTTLRESASLLANSVVFVGLVGFLMHLARAVDCRAVIVYGGRESPTQTGYAANQNLYSPVACAPCWLRNTCDYNHKCMDMISVEQVVAAAAEQISRHGTPLEVETAEI